MEMDEEEKSEDQTPTLQVSEQTGNFNKVDTSDKEENDKLLKALRTHFLQKAESNPPGEGGSDSEGEIKNVVEGAAL